MMTIGPGGTPFVCTGGTAGAGHGGFGGYM